MKLFRLTGIVIIISLILFSCRKEISNEGNTYLLRLKFKPMANGEELQPGKSYLNPIGEDFSVSSFKMYLGHLALIEDGTITVAENREAFYLLNTADPASLTVETAMNGSSFSHIGFQIGIDSSLNVSGAQSGVLDPANGMFWTWNTGYIMVKLEGNSTYSTAVNNAMVYHIGGFKTGESALRKVVATLPNQQNWSLEKNSVTELVIEINLDKWFSSVHRLPIAATPAIMTPGAVSMQYADNYATLFNPSSISRK